MSDKAFRLRGYVDGLDRSYLLVRGTNRVGSAPTNEVTLPVTGVSRQHAIIRVEPDQLLLQDLDSKNGTHVNGEMVAEHRLAVGDRIEFGPVMLELEPTSLSSSRLAIHFDQPKTPVEIDEPTETAFGGSEVLLLEALDRFAENLDGNPTRLTVALESFRKQIGATGLIMLAGLEPAVFAVTGDDVASLSATLRELWTDHARATAERALETGRWNRISHPESSSTFAFLPRGNEVFGLLLIGAMPGASDTWMRILLRLAVGREISRSPHDGDHEEEPAGLVFPPHYEPGHSTVIQALYREMESIAQTDLPVLLEGETGVGKELLAKTIHASSPRHAKPFVAINCAAIPNEMVEAELFGIGRGVATGVLERPGCFVQASGGTLFLDEIGEMPLAIQAKLLRALQDKTIQPLGRPSQVVDVRILAATNANLHQKVEEAAFRRDLFYRLSGGHLHVPPLRDRRDDIPDLVRSILLRWIRQVQYSVKGLTAGALERLLRYPWPGNIRELENELRRALYRCPPNQPIDIDLFSEAIQGVTRNADSLADLNTLELKIRVQDVERQTIREALDKAAGNRSLAAELLGIHRNTLAAKIESLGLAED